jgi:hypothetical protein
MRRITNNERAADAVTPTATRTTNNIHNKNTHSLAPPINHLQNPNWDKQ